MEKNIDQTEKQLINYDLDHEAFADHRSDRNNRNTTKYEGEIGENGKRQWVPLEDHRTMVSDEDWINYPNYAGLVDEVNFLKTQESMPRDQREYKEKYITPDYIGHTKVNEYSYSTSPHKERIKKISRNAAKLLTLNAVQNVKKHLDLVGEAYKPGTELNTKAHLQAIAENRDRQYGLGLESRINPSNINLEDSLNDSKKYASLSTFGKLDFIRENAYRLVDENSLPFVTKTDTSTTILASRSEVRVAPTIGSSGGWTYKHSESYGIGITKTEDDKIVVDVYDFGSSAINRYSPVSKTIVNKDSSASTQNYDAKSGTYGDAIKLGKSELDNVYTRLIQGKIVPDIQEAA